MNKNLLAFYLFKINKRNFSLLLIVIQSCGIRFFSGQGTVLAFVILLLLFKPLARLKRKTFLIFLFLSFFFTISKIFNPQFTFGKLVFQFILILETVVFLASYKNPDQLFKDLNFVLKIVFFHALLTYLLYLVIPSGFSGVSISGMTYKAMLHIFYLDNFRNFIRNSGICWEPGVLQLMLNLYLFISIKNGKNVVLLFLICLTIFSTFSTSGFVILALNYLYFLHVNFITNKKRFILIIALTVLASVPIGIIESNLSNKLEKDNTSRLVRYRDFLIGLALIKEKPLIGHGTFANGYLASKYSVSQIEQQVFTPEFLSENEDMAGGYTNGLLGLLCWYGLPLGLLTYIFVYRNRIFELKTFGRTILFISLLVSFTSEPITYTPFFLLFPFSFLMFKNKEYYSLQKLYYDNQNSKPKSQS